MNQELWHAFDRIKAGLDRQEQMRSTPAFGEWCVKALPQFSQYLDRVDAWDDANPGGLLCEWHDWLEARGLWNRWNATPKWQYPTTHPLSFCPPTMAHVMARAAKEVRDLNLVGALSRYRASLEARTSATPGGSGARKARKSRPKKSTPGTPTS